MSETGCQAIIYKTIHLISSPGGSGPGLRLHIESHTAVGIEPRIICLVGFFFFPWKQEIESQLSPEASGDRAGAGNTRKQIHT